MIKSPIIPIAALALLCASLPSCATIISGTSQMVTIDSNVEGADVRIDGNTVGVTPYSGKIRRQKDTTARVEKDGYAPQTVTLTTAFNPVATLSIFWDLSTTDFLSGAAWEYAPSTYYVNLKPKGMANAAFKKDSSAKAFAMTYYGDLQAELVSGEGPLLRALRDEYFQDITLENLVEQLNAVSFSSAVEFGESVGSLLSA